MHALRLNAKLFSLILHKVLQAFDQSGSCHISSEGQQDSERQLHLALQKFLPSLRYFSAWFTYRASWFVKEMEDEELDQTSNEMLTAYRDVVHQLSNNFDYSKLPSIQYLLKEDHRTIGFEPFQDFTNPRLKARYFFDGKPKLNSDEYESIGPTLDETGEMLGRVRDILEDYYAIEKDKVSGFLATKVMSESQSITGQPHTAQE